MADITKRVPDCDDDCEGERGERGKRGKRGHDGNDGPAGPTGPAGLVGPTGPVGPTGSFTLTPTSWTMKFAGSTTEGTTVSLSDDAASVLGNPSGARRTPLAGDHTTSRMIFRTISKSLSAGATATIHVLKNGTSFASMPAPESGGNGFLDIPNDFPSGSDISIEVVTTAGEGEPGSIDVDGTVAFVGPIGPDGPEGEPGATGPTGPVGPEGPPGRVGPTVLKFFGGAHSNTNPSVDRGFASSLADAPQGYTPLPGNAPLEYPLAIAINLQNMAATVLDGIAGTIPPGGTATITIELRRTRGFATTTLFSMMFNRTSPDTQILPTPVTPCLPGDKLRLFVFCNGFFIQNPVNLAVTIGVV